MKGEYSYAATPEKVFYHDLDSEGQKTAISKLQHQSARIFTDRVLYEPWHDMLCTYLYCEADQALFLPIQQHLAQSLGTNAMTFTSVGSHSPFLSQPQEIVEGVEYAVKVALEKQER